MTGLSMPPISTSSFEPPTRRPDLQVSVPVMEAYFVSLSATAATPLFFIAVEPVEVGQHALEVRQEPLQEGPLVGHGGVEVAVEERLQRARELLALVALLDAADDRGDVCLHPAQFVGH